MALVEAVYKELYIQKRVFQIPGSDKKVVLEDMYEEISNVVSLEDFEKLYDHATDKPYGSLIIDTTNGKRFMSNLDAELFLQK